jgi:molecular chaperone DnaJ
MGESDVTRKSHYTILGISRSASPEGVRSAFLRLAKERHPDHAGESSAPAFREIQQAYDVLSDPVRRRRYDQESEQKRPVRSWRPDPLTRQQRVEPLVPDPVSPVPGWPPRFGIFDEYWDLLDRGPSPITDRRSRATGAVDVEAVIPAGLAERGGPCSIALPVREICGHCLGTGIVWPSSCPACGQTGWTTHEETLRLQLPPGIRHGTVIELRSNLAGGSGLRLRLLVGTARRAPPVR